MPRRVWIVAFTVVVGLIAAAIGVTVASDSGTERGNDPSRSPVTTPSTLTPTTTTTVPSTTTTTFLPGEDRLSSASRLGYAGLGPIKLGMTVQEASATSGLSIVEDTGPECPGVRAYIRDFPFPQPPPGNGEGIRTLLDDNHRIASIEINSPTLSTISGVRVGQHEADAVATYPNAELTVLEPRHQRAIVIKNAQGHVVVFFEGWQLPNDRSQPEDIVSILVATSIDWAKRIGLCY